MMKTNILFIRRWGKAKEKPRIKCIKLGNSYHMVNGIGEFQEIQYL